MSCENFRLMAGNAVEPAVPYQKSPPAAYQAAMGGASSTRGKVAIPTLSIDMTKLNEALKSS